MTVFRFGNTMFEPFWNRNYIDHVQITVAETVSVSEGPIATTRLGCCAICSRTI
jgi:hypothetical protein